MVAMAVAQYANCPSGDGDGQWGHFSFLCRCDGAGLLFTLALNAQHWRLAIKGGQPQAFDQGHETRSACTSGVVSWTGCVA